MEHERWMRRCLQLARHGAGTVAPNPMVGALLVQGDRILAEGWHRSFGGPHAEVECLRAFGDGAIPSDAVMYVNLEPCSHHGKTPPCVDLLIEREVKRLVVGCIDPNPEVHLQGIARARAQGIDVITGVLETECRWLNRRFIHAFERGRPYVILKWARSSDGFLDDHGRTARISSHASDVLVHRWRAEEQAVLVGSRTVINDDPALTVRHAKGRNPVRVVIDRNNSAPASARIFDGSAPTLLITERPRGDASVEQHLLGMIDDPIDAVLVELQRRSVRSVLVEGGAQILGHFIRKGCWEEMRVITGARELVSGTPAPPTASPALSMTSGPDRIDLYVNGTDPAATWDW